MWFSLPTVAAVAERVGEELAAIDAEHAEEYRANARAFADDAQAAGPAGVVSAVRPAALLATLCALVALHRRALRLNQRSA